VVAVFRTDKVLMITANTNKESIFSWFSRFKTIYGLQSHCDFDIGSLTGVGLRKRRRKCESCPCLLSIGVKSMMLSSWKIDEKLSFTGGISKTFTGKVTPI
jgi:hypothetical protein